MVMMLDRLEPLVRAGFALHWLVPKSKRPYDGNWSELPVPTLDELRASHSVGDNVGVRLGKPSLLGSVYLHVIDVDIRVADLADEAMERLRELFPDVDSWPSVISGSGGASRHFYFVTDKPFRSRLLAASGDKIRRFDKAQNKDVWSNTYEIEMFGTGKQVVLPPSIHPDTGNPYQWEREFDFDLLEMGFGPHVSSETIEALGVAEEATYAYEAVEPLDFKPGQLEGDLDVVPVSDLHYDDWIRLGQALHHQFGGAQEGFDLWLKHTRRSAKYTGERQDREMRRIKWRSFGKYRGRPVTMATIRQWAQEARQMAMMAELDDLTDDLDDEDDEGDAQSEEIDEDFADFLGVGGDSLADEFDAADAKAPKDETPPSGEWMSLFDLTDKGAIRSTLPNIELILANDPRFIGVPQHNEFTHETVQRITPGTKPSRRKAAKPTRQLTGKVWDVKDCLNGDLWSDDRDFAIRSVMEAPKTQGGYGINVADRNLKAAVVNVADKNRFHPVREYLSGLKWDGKPRAEGLFIDYVGAPNDAYHRDTARLWLIAAVTRIFEPGHKFDYVPILEGLQGKRKSTFIETLAKSWFAELDGNFHDSKQMVELMMGAWVMEIPELSGVQRADIRAVKAFMSRKKDRVRLAYARRAGEYPRSCVFMGSTNDREYLKDDTGGRRFWPIECRLPIHKEIDIDLLERNVNQIWAEAVHLYREMRAAQPHGTLPLYLADRDAGDIALSIQESRRIETPEDVLAGHIAAWLDKPVMSGSVDEDTDENGKPLRRDVTCTMEIRMECLGDDMAKFITSGSIPHQIGRAMRLIQHWRSDAKRVMFPKYGQQRRWIRISDPQ